MKKKVFLIGLILVILGGVVFTTKYYFRKGTVFGDIYVTMKSGDVKRITGMDVVLYKETTNADNVKQEIMNIDKQYRLPWAYALAEYYDPSAPDAKKDQLLAKIKNIEDERNAKVNGVLNPLFFKKGKTDINGHYEFLDIPYGKYLVFSQCTILERTYNWLHQIEVGNRKNKIDLTYNNMYEGDMFYDAYELILEKEKTK